MMKKLSSLFMVVLLVVSTFAVVGCGGVDNSATKPNVKVPEVKESTDAEKKDRKDGDPNKTYSGNGGATSGVMRGGGSPKK